jgi:hypothetical protein
VMQLKNLHRLSDEKKNEISIQAKNHKKAIYEAN